MHFGEIWRSGEKMLKKIVCGLGLGSLGAFIAKVRNVEIRDNARGEMVTGSPFSPLLEVGLLN
jgi:hypothetical protein